MRTIIPLILSMLIVLNVVHAQNTSCVSFDGINDIVTMGGSSDFDITTNLTLEAWVKVDEDQFNDFNRIIDKFNFVEEKGYNLIVNGGHLFMEFFSPDGGSHSAYSNAFIADGQWHHVAGTFSTDEIRLYIDGVLDISEDVGLQTIQPSSNTLGIGNNWDGQAFLPFRGQIDEARIWNITRSEEAINTNKDLCLTGNEPGLVGYWRFDENAGLIANDLTANGNDGNLGNGTTWEDSGLPAQACSPLEAVITGTDGTCGLPNGSASVSPEGGVPSYTYLWSNGETSQTISNLVAGIYAVTVTDANGITVTGDVNISNTSPVSANAGSTDETAFNANDGTASASPFGGTPTYSFTWSNGSTDQMISDLAPGVYTVTVTDTEGCSDIQSVTVAAFECPDLFLEATLSNINCFGACDVSMAILEVVQGVAPFTYNWSTGSTESFIVDLCAGSYSVTVTDANGCIVSEIYEILQPDELLPNATSTAETAQGVSDGTASAAPTGGVEPYEFEWSNGSTNAMITGLIPGSYTVTVTDANFCINTQTVIVNPFTCINLLDVTLLNVSCFGGCDGRIGLLVNGTGAITYVWSTGSTAPAIENLCASIYSVTIIDDGLSCSSTYEFEIQQPELLVVSVDQVVNITDSTTSAISITVIGGTPPYIYVWSGPDGFASTSEDVSGMDAGLYAVVVTDANGCTTQIDSIEVRDETVGTSQIHKLDVRVYPNPTRGLLHLDVFDVTEFEVQLRTLDGRIVETWNTTKTIDVSKYSEGMYMMRFISGERQFVYRLVIAR